MLCWVQSTDRQWLKVPGTESGLFSTGDVNYKFQVSGQWNLEGRVLAVLLIVIGRV